MSISNLSDFSKCFKKFYKIVKIYLKCFTKFWQFSIDQCANINLKFF